MSKIRKKFPVRIILSFGFLFVVIVGLYGAGAPSPALSQSADDSWETPLNLSHSGGTTNPLMVVDVHGVIHVIWEDIYEEHYVYSHFDGETWSTPVVVEFPFHTYLPKLVADKKGLIHAFWADDQNRLFYSHVSDDIFGNSNGWETPIKLAESALDVDVIVDNLDSLHLTYVRDLQTVDYPAGIYYLRSKDGGSIWAPPILIYQSAYFRGLTSENANVNIVSATYNNETRVYIAWDNRPRKLVFLDYSSDGGDKWQTPVEINKPDPQTGFAASLNIKVNAYAQNVFLLWQSSNPGASCTQIFQWSVDGGVTWNDDQTNLEGILGCLQNNRFITIDNGLILLMTTIKEQVFFLAWDGRQWSEPQLQSSLNSFLDTETSDPVIFRCRQTVFLPGKSRLFTIGCDEGTGKDIWLMSRPIRSVDDWFPPPPAWSSPTDLMSAEVGISSPIIISDAENRFHVFWSQTRVNNANSPDASLSTGKAIYYTRSEGKQWSRPTVIFGNSGEKAENPAVVIDHQGRLLVVWEDGESGDIIFSWAKADRAMIASEWSSPEYLPSPQSKGSSPDIYVDAAGKIYVVYAVPINEKRGIYLTLSNDNGQTWSKPVLIFNGAAAGWEMVDRPHLVATSGNRLAVLWTKHTMSSNSDAVGLYYAYSNNGGQNWSNEIEITTKTIDWDQIMSYGDGQLHRFWQESANANKIVWGDVSQDAGLTWSRPEVVSSFLGGLGIVTLTMDGRGQPHLVQIIDRGSKKYELDHLSWNGEGWIANESAEIDKKDLGKINTLSAAVSPGGKLAVIYIESFEEQSKQSQALFYMESSANLPQATLEIKPTLIQPTITTQAPSSTIPPTLSPTPTLDLSRIAITEPSGNNRWTGLILGTGLAGIIIAFVLALRRYLYWKNNY